MTSLHLWKRAHQIASFKAALRVERSRGWCATSARTVSMRQPPNIGRSGPLSGPAETAVDNGVAPFSSSTVGSAPWASSNLRMAGSVSPAARSSGVRPPGPTPRFTSAPRSRRSRTAAGCRCYLAHGGHEFDGRVLSSLREEELRTIAADLRLHAVQSSAARKSGDE